MSKIAAIDVGSNAMRMVVGKVSSNGQVDAMRRLRFPVRLGQDVFHKGYLQEQSIQKTEAAFWQFRQEVDDCGVRQIRAVATSAVRDAANRRLLVERVWNASGVKIEVIDGLEEARLIHSAVMQRLDLRHKRVLLIDIGGGSVEVTLSRGAQMVSTASYDIGTVRLLELIRAKRVPKPMWMEVIADALAEVGKRIVQDLNGEGVQICVGTGGNIEEIGRLRQRLFKGESKRIVTSAELERLIENLARMTYTDRLKKLKLRPDRADVILPAALILQLITQTAGVKQVYIPHVGLREGVLLNLAKGLT